MVVHGNMEWSCSSPQNESAYLMCSVCCGSNICPFTVLVKVTMNGTLTVCHLRYMSHVSHPVTVAVRKTMQQPVLPCTSIVWDQCWTYQQSCMRLCTTNAETKERCNSFVRMQEAKRHECEWCFSFCVHHSPHLLLLLHFVQSSPCPLTLYHPYHTFTYRGGELHLLVGVVKALLLW